LFGYSVIQLFSYYIIMILTIYTPEITDRIRYIMNVVFTEHLGISYQLTESISDFNKANCRISYAPQPVDNEIFIWQHTLLRENDVRQQTIEPKLLENEIVFFQSPIKQSILPFDIFSLAFYLLSRYEEYLPHEKDKYNRFQGCESIAYKYGFLQKPLVDIHVLKFAQKLKKAIPELRFETKRPEYIATYDIDNAYSYKYKGLIRTLGGLLKPMFRFELKEVIERISVLLNIKQDPFDSYKYINALQQKYHLETYYFILFSGKGKYDRGLNPGNRSFRKLLKQLDRNEEVGIHPSFASASDKEKLKEEIRGLSSVLQKKIVFSRSHFLLLTFPETYQNFIANGIKEDFTLGYADQAGFRASTCRPFNFFDLSTNKETPLILYPLTYMEKTLQDYMKLSEEEGLTLVKQLMDSVKSVNGIFISLWHNETLGKEECKKFYQQTLDYFF